MRRGNEVLVGIAVLAGVALILFGTMWLKGVRLGSEEDIRHARFTEIGQLLQGNTVKLRGVPIGRVERIALENSGAGVIVTISVDANVRLPEDPVVLLAPESMFGDWQAEIFPRTSFPDYQYAESPDPSVLPGYSLPDMTRLTAVAAEIARNLATLTDRVELAFTEETARNVREAIENIQQVSAQLTGLVSSQQVAFEGVASSLEQTSDAAAQAALTMQRAFAEVEGAIGGGKLLNIVSNVERTTSSTDSLVAILVSTSRGLRAAAASADSTMRAVGDIAQAIERGEGSLGQMLRDTALYMNLVETNIELQTLLTDIRRNPRKYINLTIF